MVILQRSIYIPVPTWGNHPKIFMLAGLKPMLYRYYDPNTRGLDYQGTAINLFVSQWLHMNWLMPVTLYPLAHAYISTGWGSLPLFAQWLVIIKLLSTDWGYDTLHSAYWSILWINIFIFRVQTINLNRSTDLHMKIYL